MDLNNPLLAVFIAWLLFGAYAVGRYGRRPAPVDQLTQMDENFRNRFVLWLRRMWGLEEHLTFHPSDTGPGAVAVEPLDDTVPVGLAAANVHVDPNHDLRAWVLHTFNLAELRLKEIEHTAKTRGPKFGTSQEAAFQRLLKDARFLRCICEAALYARSANYDTLRPALLASMERYPQYTPAAAPDVLTAAPRFDGVILCPACKHGQHGPMCSAAPRCYCDRDCNVDYSKPHEFIGRADRPCDGCERPDRDAIHVSKGEESQ